MVEGGSFRPRDPIRDLQRRVRILETRNQMLNMSVEDADGLTVFRSTVAGVEVPWKGTLTLVPDIFQGVEAHVDRVNDALTAGINATNARLNEGGDVDGRIDDTWAHAQKGLDVGRGAQTAADGAQAAADAAQATADQALAAAQGSADPQRIHDLMRAAFDRITMLQNQLNSLQVSLGKDPYPYPDLPAIDLYK